MESLAVTPRSPGSTTSLTAALTNFGEKSVVVYQFGKESGEWRVTDILEDGKSYLSRLPR